MTENVQAEHVTKTNVERLLDELRERLDEPADDDMLERIVDDLSAAVELDKAEAADVVDPAVAALSVDAAGERERERVLGILLRRIDRIGVSRRKLSGEDDRAALATLNELREIVNEVAPAESPEPPELDLPDPLEPEAELPAEEP